MTSLLAMPQFISVLRSGKYKRGKYMVNSLNKTLCVLAVLAVESGFMKLNQDFSIQRYDQTRFNSSIGLGRFDAAGAICLKIVQLNDDSDLSFTQIADFLEQSVQLTEKGFDWKTN